MRSENISCPSNIFRDWQSEKHLNLLINGHWINKRIRSELKVCSKTDFCHNDRKFIQTAQFLREIYVGYFVTCQGSNCHSKDSTCYFNRKDQKVFSESRREPKDSNWRTEGQWVSGWVLIRKWLINVKVERHFWMIKLCGWVEGLIFYLFFRTLFSWMHTFSSIK